ncbi:MAG: hypothetical protein GXY83_02935 [Rhodopirellula sp.]|nr:hypothetical protein [Rhodopirellula sp.]
MAIEFHGGVDPFYWLVVPVSEVVYRNPCEANEAQKLQEGSRLLGVRLTFMDNDSPEEPGYCREFWAVVSK